VNLFGAGEAGTSLAPAGLVRLHDRGVATNLSPNSLETPRGVVEAKRASLAAALGQEQALQYAQDIQRMYGGSIPLIFYTNGYDIYFWESDFYPPVKVYGFPTHDDLE
jgi:type I site-specific restriction endonuclease